MGAGLDMAMKAVHEAGHCAATLSLGYRVESARLDPPEIVAVFGPGAWKAELTVLMAGDAAVAHAGSKDRAWTDADDACQLVARVGATPLELHFARVRAEALVAEQWGGIERIAAALLRHNLVLGSTARRLLVGGETDAESLFLLKLALAARAA